MNTDVLYALKQLRLSQKMGTLTSIRDCVQRAIDALERVETQLKFEAEASPDIDNDG